MSTESMSFAIFASISSRFRKVTRSVYPSSSKTQKGDNTNDFGEPIRAALLAFALALIAFNPLGVVKAALRKQHGTAKIQQELSAFFLGESVQRAEARRYKGLVGSV